MRFCDACGSRMRETAEGFLCLKCGRSIRSRAKARVRNTKKGLSDAIYVVDKSPDENSKVDRVCPSCGHEEAFYWSSSISGEHAGVQRERTLKHFRCTKCSHSWTETA